MESKNTTRELTIPNDRKECPNAENDSLSKSILLIEIKFDELKVTRGAMKLNALKKRPTTPNSSGSKACVK
jgi:hypothetical protein